MALSGGSGAPFRDPEPHFTPRPAKVRGNTVFSALFHFCFPRAMSLELDDVTKIANLARIEISEDEAKATLAQLNNIFDLIEEMKAVNTDGVAPMSHGIEVNQRLREDKVTETNHREENQAPAPQVAGGFYLVPQVIE